MESAAATREAARQETEATCTRRRAHGKPGDDRGGRKPPGAGAPPDGNGLLSAPPGGAQRRPAKADDGQGGGGGSAGETSHDFFADCPHQRPSPHLCQAAAGRGTHAEIFLRAAARAAPVRNIARSIHPASRETSRHLSRAPARHSQPLGTCSAQRTTRGDAIKLRGLDNPSGAHTGGRVLNTQTHLSSAYRTRPHHAGSAAFVICPERPGAVL